MDVSSPTKVVSEVLTHPQLAKVWSPEKFGGMVRNAFCFDFFQIFWGHRRDLSRGGFFDIETLGGGSTVVTTELMFLQVFGIQMSTGPDQHLAKVWRFENRVRIAKWPNIWRRLVVPLPESCYFFVCFSHPRSPEDSNIYIYIHIIYIHIYVYIYVHIYIYICMYPYYI